MLSVNKILHVLDECSCCIAQNCIKLARNLSKQIHQDVILQQLNYLRLIHTSIVQTMFFSFEMRYESFAISFDVENILIAKPTVGLL